MKRTFIMAAVMALTALSGTARQPERGYRGFAEWTNRINHHTDTYWSKTYYIPGIATSHGYQFNPWLFAGAGIDCSFDDIGFAGHHAYSARCLGLSLFGEVRTDLQFGNFTPFGDVRLGWNACERGTVYFSPTIGYRFNWGRKVGINVGIGYTLDAYRSERYIIGQTPEGWQIYVPTGEFFNWSQSWFTFRVGFDF